MLPSDIADFCVDLNVHVSRVFGGSLHGASLYLRGSFINPSVFEPLDIDFVLFVDDEDSYSLRFREDFSEKISNIFPTLPLVDISIYPKEFRSQKGLYGRLLISSSSLLVRGESMNIDFEIFRLERVRVLDYMMDVCKRRLLEYSKCSFDEVALRTPHLSKAILRLGGALLISEGKYTRDVCECSSILLKYFPVLGDGVFSLMESFEKDSSRDTISKASIDILNQMDLLMLKWR